MDTLSKDVRYGIRSLLKRPAFIAALTLAHGTGANTAIVCASNALLLKPPPFPDSDRLVARHE